MDAALRRRSDRIFTMIPIWVSATDALGLPFEEKASTVNINGQGACITLAHSLLPQTLVQIKNLENGRREEFRAVGVVHRVFGDRQEWGVAAVRPKSDIWGVEFTLPAEGLQPKVLIQCTACRKEVLNPVSRIEYRVFLSTGCFSRYCDQCGETTRWGPGEITLPTERIDNERRKHLRRKLTMRLTIRSHGNRTDLVQTIDVSTSGLCFMSKGAYQVGDEIYLTLPFPEKHAAEETKGRIMWAREEAIGRFYGVLYMK
ncbi:MAG: PilZ domain-containing protein [Acidobacteriia bacterium]|nr:PilZ domain-containing protein [Terriglobia bacterium]